MCFSNNFMWYTDILDFWLHIKWFLLVVLDQKTLRMFLVLKCWEFPTWENVLQSLSPASTDINRFQSLGISVVLHQICPELSLVSYWTWYKWIPLHDLHHLESRWRNSHVLVHHGRLLIHLLGVAPSTFTTVYLSNPFTPEVCKNW